MRTPLIFTLFVRTVLAGLVLHPESINSTSFVAYESLVPTFIHEEYSDENSTTEASKSVGALFQPFEPFNQSGEVRLLNAREVSALVIRNDWTSNSSELSGKVLIIPLELMDNVRYICGNLEDFWEDYVCSIARLCSLRPVAIIQEHFASSWFFPKRWLSEHGRGLLRKYNIDRNCSHFRSYGHFLSSEVIERVSGMRGVVTVEDSSIDPLRSHYVWTSVVLFRILYSVGYLYLTLLATWFAVHRHLLRKLNSVYILLYTFNGVTCAVLAVTYIIGPFFLFDLTSPRLEQLQVSLGFFFLYIFSTRF